MQSSATWDWEQRGEGHQTPAPTVEQVKLATCLGRYGYAQAPVVNPCFSLFSEIVEAFYAYELFIDCRRDWAASCGRMTDNKETYKLLIEDRIWFISFYDGFVYIGEQVRTLAVLQEAK
jgi:hypothetical protein